MTIRHRPHTELWPKVATRFAAAQWLGGAVLLLIEEVRGGSNGTVGTSLPAALVLVAVAAAIVDLGFRARARSFRAQRALVVLLGFLTLWTFLGLVVGQPDEAFGFSGPLGLGLTITLAAVHAVALAATVSNPP